MDKGSAAIVVKGDLLDIMTNRSKSFLVKSANEPKVMGNSSFILGTKITIILEMSKHTKNPNNVIKYTDISSFGK